MEPHMIENYISIVFVIVVNHVGFIVTMLKMEDNYFYRMRKLFALSCSKDISSSDRFSGSF